MSEDQDDSSKTEEPSGRKIDKAHDEGQFAISREVNQLMAMLGIMIIVAWLAPPITGAMMTRLTHFIANFNLIRTDSESIRQLVAESMLYTVAAAGLPLILLLILGVLATVLQIGFRINSKNMNFDLSKLSPLTGMKRLFKLDTQALEMGKNLVKLFAVGAVSYIVLKPVVISFEHYIGMDLAGVMAEIHHVAFKLLVALLLVVFVITLIDFAYQQYTFHKTMMMSKQDVKEEHKSTEGDPLIKNKLRNLRYQKAQQRMMASVPKADVVITNPTHYAVALKYDPASGKAPVVLAKGVDFLAANIRKAAEEHNIPLVRNPPLARTLYDTVKIDQEIPAEHYRAVAEVITFVYKLKGKTLG
ncbi:MAG: flagellar biosynthesis protein FlhB [Rhodospirillaceae bacterium]